MTTPTTATPTPAAAAKPATAPPAAVAVRRRDWSWRHGPVIGPVNGGSGVVALAMVGDLAAVSPWAGVAAGAAGAFAIGARSITRQVSPLGIGYRVGCMVGAGGWLTWALAASAWAPNVLAAAVIGVAGAGLAAPAMGDHEARTRRTRRDAADAAAVLVESTEAHARRIEIAKRWEGYFRDVCHIDTLIEGAQVWPGETGYSLQVRMIGRPVTWRELGKWADALAGAADLPNGCGVEVVPGPSRAVHAVKVSIVDTTATPVPYPADYSPLSFTRPLPIGMHRAAVPATIELLEDPAVICGRPGSGKTVALQVINLDLARCTDALIWHIDLNGAGMSSPWLRPWLEGRADRPAVDWTAPTEEEAVLMAETLIKICQGRKPAYQDLMKSVNDDKLPISARVPAIVLVVDEGAEAVSATRGNRRLATALETVVATCRAMRGRVIITGVRATADIIPMSIQSAAGVKIWMRPEDQHETAQLLGWQPGLSVEDAPWPGSGLVRKPGTAGIRPYRGHSMRPDQIDEAAVATAALRPYLDPPSTQIAGAAYADRWTRYKAWLSAQAGGDTTMTTPNPSDPDAGRPKGQGVAGLAGAAAGLDDAMAELRRVREQRATEPQEKTSAEPDFDHEFERIIAGYQADHPAGAVLPAGGVEKMAELLTEAGPDGIHYETLHARLKAAGVHVSQATLFRWLKSAERVDGKPGVYRRPADPS